jgi:hypothetical protein
MRLAAAGQADLAVICIGSASRAGGDTCGMKRGRVQLGVPEQNLNNANIGILLEQVRGKALSRVCRSGSAMAARPGARLVGPPARRAATLQ